MERRGLPQEPDPLLRPFLQAASEEESLRLLERLLIDHAEPAIRSFIGSKLRVSPDPQGKGLQSQDEMDAEDVCREAIGRLMRRLAALKASPGCRSISDFRAYVEETARNAYHDYLRRKYPLRTRLKNSLCYLLDNRTGRKGFARWRHGQEWLCGLGAWCTEGRGIDRRRYLHLLQNPQAFWQESQPHRDIQEMDLADLMEAILTQTGGPVEIEDLVGIVSELRQIRDEPPLSQTDFPDDESKDPLERFPDPDAQVEEQALRAVSLPALREAARMLWTEILQLRPYQRAVLLLSLQDQEEGITALDLLCRTEAATMIEIAGALDLHEEALRGLWPDLPLSDAAIMERLGLKDTQTVINLRKAAVSRLGRRLKRYDPYVAALFLRDGNVR